MRIYLAGPMTGIPYYNFPAFDTAADALRGLGHEVFNPADNDRMNGFDPEFLNLSEGKDAALHGFDLRKALLEDLTWICHNADAIAVLDNWVYSRGAQAEIALADALSIPFAHWTQFDELGIVDMKRITELEEALKNG